MQNRVNMWKRIVFALIACMFISCLNHTAAKAEETKIPDSSIAIDYEKQELTVAMGDNTTIFYGKGTKDKAPSDWDAVTDSQVMTKKINGSNQKAAVIDISFVSASKDEYIYLKGNKATNPTSVEIKKQLKLKVTYVGLLNDTTDPGAVFKTVYETKNSGLPVYPGFSEDTGYFIFKADNQNYTDFTKIQWRKGAAGTWQSFDTLTLNKYIAKGSTFYFRINNQTQQISNECKLNYAKAANAPKITIDGAKHTIKLTNKMEYRVKVASGSFLTWTTPTFEGGKSSGAVNIDSLNGVADAQNGNGISSAFNDMVIEVRLKATDKKTYSKTESVTLYRSTTPAFGANGIEVVQVDSGDIKKGLKVTNHTNLAYQYAILDKKVNESTSGSYAAIAQINLTAKNKDTGYVAFSNIAPGKSTTIPYKKFEKFKDRYVIVCRVAAIKENTKTPEIEFRLASNIMPIGGDTPQSDIKSGAVMMKSSDTTISKIVTFTAGNPNSVIYTSLDNAAFAANTSGKVTVNGTKGSKHVVKAYTKDRITGEVSETVMVSLSFVADGELSHYANEWGYVLCKKEDAQNNANSRQIAYQRIYLAYSTYTAAVSVTDLGLTRNEIYNIVQRVRVDHPELLQAKGSFSCMAAGAYASELSLDFYSQDSVNTWMTECEASLTEVKNKIKAAYGDSPSKLQKIKVIHDYLVLTKEYKSSSMDQTMVGSLCKDYTPVCMSYSMAFKYLCDELDIQSYVVIGYTGGKTSNRHAWNNVNLGEVVSYSAAGPIDASNWYEMDVTWDDPVGAPVDFVQYKYFNVTTAALTAAEHTRFHEYYSSYPVENCTGTTYTAAALNAESNYSDGKDRNDKEDSKEMKELISRSDEKAPEMRMIP